MRTELETKGYTKDAVVITCCVCNKKVTCKWERNKTKGIHYGRPLIHIPEDWKVIYTYGSTKQDVCCPNCTPDDKGEGAILLG